MSCPGGHGHGSSRADLRRAHCSPARTPGTPPNSDRALSHCKAVRVQSNAGTADFIGPNRIDECRRMLDEARKAVYASYTPFFTCPRSRFTSSRSSDEKLIVPYFFYRLNDSLNLRAALGNETFLTRTNCMFSHNFHKYHERARQVEPMVRRLTIQVPNNSFSLACRASTRFSAGLMILSGNSFTTSSVD